MTKCLIVKSSVIPACLEAKSAAYTSANEKCHEHGVLVTFL